MRNALSPQLSSAPDLKLYENPDKPAGKPASSSRLVSLDAYRGFVMLLMASSGLGIVQYVKEHHLHGAWPYVAYNLDHVEWRGTGLGAGLWDMIQPSFTFIVGVAMPFSLAKRRAQGETFGWLLFHALFRSWILVALGIFLRSLNKPMTSFTFEDTLTQIGLGYTFAFLLSWVRPRWQVLAIIVILAGYWTAFAYYKLPAAGFDYNSVGVSEEWRANNPISRPDAPFHHLAEHWDKNTNAAAAFDVWFLNRLPRMKPFAFNAGGYLTLSFIPTLGTMLLGLLAGNLMISRLCAWSKIGLLILFGAAGVAAGWALDWFGICPNVKRIWTPSWALYSGGISCLMLAVFYIVVDCAGQRWIAFPAIVVGMNSIAMYCLADGGFKSFIRSAFDTHLGGHIFRKFDDLTDWMLAHIYPLFHRDVPHRAGSLEMIAQNTAILLVLWLICFWMYRRKIFLRI